MSGAGGGRQTVKGNPLVQTAQGPAPALHPQALEPRLKTGLTSFHPDPAGFRPGQLQDQAGHPAGADGFPVQSRGAGLPAGKIGIVEV